MSHYQYFCLGLRSEGSTVKVTIVNRRHSGTVLIEETRSQRGIYFSLTNIINGVFKQHS